MGVADTHAAIWYLFADTRLSAAAKAFIDQAAVTDNAIAISPISLAELVYLVEKKRLPMSAYEELAAALADPLHLFTEIPLTSGIVKSMRQIARAEIPDMPDRLIAATGAYLRVPIISRDRRIRATGLDTIW